MTPYEKAREFVVDNPWHCGAIFILIVLGLAWWLR
jgi:hypothetical protein